MKNFDNDVMDEFEFKPLTAGLGFHKKTDARNNESASVRQDKIEFRNPNMNFSGSSTHSTVATTTMRHQNQSNNSQPKISIPTIEDDSILKAQSAVNEILKNLNHKKQIESQQKTKSKFEWKSTTPSIAAAALDAMFVIAMFLVCMICMLIITKVDLIANLANPGENGAILISTIILLLMVSFVYMTLFRTYLGYTPGEWAFDQRCGKEIDQASSSYVFKVILRSLVVSLTGFLPLTIVSLFLKFDLTGTIINLPLQKRA
jgi:hypothetical protein